MSELVQSGRTLAEIAGYDLKQLKWVICRPRDKHGRLIRKDPELPDWVGVDENGMRVVRNPCSFRAAFSHAGKTGRGWREDRIKASWQTYLADNPGLALRQSTGELFSPASKVWREQDGQRQGVVSRGRMDFGA